MSLGVAIKTLRKLKGLTQVQLAEKTNLSRSYIADIERERYNPSVESLRAIAEALDTDLSSLFYEINGINPDLSEKLRLILMELSEGPYLQRSFPEKTVSLIKEKLKGVESIYGIDFEITPASINETCRESKNEALVVDVIKALEAVNEELKNDIRTIAAHHDGDDWTEEELEEIERFKEFIRLKRQQRG